MRIEGRERGRSFYQAYWVVARSLGHAIERVLLVAEMCGVADPIARAAESLGYPVLLPDEESWPTPTDDVVCGGRCYFPVLARFVLPYGTIESGQASDLASTRIRPGYARHCPQTGMLVAVVTRDQLEPVLASLIGLMRAIALVSVEHFRSCRAGGDFWVVTEDMRTPGAVLDFFGDHRDNLLCNGFVNLSVVSRGDLCVTLDEHKLLRVEVHSTKRLARVEQALIRQGVRPNAGLIEPPRFPHHHFRPPGSLGGRGLGKLLAEHGFFLGMEPLHRPAGPRL